MKPETIDHGIIMPKELSSTNWELTFKKGNSITDTFFSNWQLGFGTLLGAVREEDQYIHHDIDIDVDVLLHKDEEKVLHLFDKKMVENGFSPLRKRWFPYLGKRLLMSTAYNHRETNTIYDVCFFRKWGTDYLHLGADGLVIRPCWSEVSQEFQVKGNKCYIPALYQDYLKGRYGDDWMIPIHKKDNWDEDAIKGNLFIPWDFGVSIKREFK